MRSRFKVTPLAVVGVCEVCGNSHGMVGEYSVQVVGPAPKNKEGGSAVSCALVYCIYKAKSLAKKRTVK